MRKSDHFICSTEGKLGKREVGFGKQVMGPFQKWGLGEEWKQRKRYLWIQAIYLVKL